MSKQTNTQSSENNRSKTYFGREQFLLRNTELRNILYVECSRFSFKCQDSWKKWKSPPTSALRSWAPTLTTRRSKLNMSWKSTKCLIWSVSWSWCFWSTRSTSCSCWCCWCLLVLVLVLLVLVLVLDYYSGLYVRCECTLLLWYVTFVILFNVIGDRQFGIASQQKQSYSTHYRYCVQN